MNIWAPTEGNRKCNTRIKEMNNDFKQLENSFEKEVLIWKKYFILFILKIIFFKGYLSFEEKKSKTILKKAN